MRAGRVKNTFGLYNEGRDAIWTRPGVLLPESIYFDALALRQPELSSDGGIFYVRHGFGDHALSAEFTLSDPQETAGGPDFLIGIPDAPGSLGGRLLYIGRAGYEWREGRVRLFLTVVDLDRDFDFTSPLVPSGNIDVFFPLASAQVNLEDWSFTGEYGRISIERTGIFPSFFPEFFLKNTSENYYLQTEYRFAPGWSGCRGTASTPRT